MAQVTVKIGAPSLAGKDCTEDIKAAFEKSSYPLSVKVKNLMPRDACFPEVEGLWLTHVANPTKSEKTLEIKDYALFARLASSVSQVAEINNFNPAMEFTADGTEIEEDNEESETKVGTAKVGTAKTGTEAQQVSLMSAAATTTQTVKKTSRRKTTAAA